MLADSCVAMVWSTSILARCKIVQLWPTGLGCGNIQKEQSANVDIPLGMDNWTLGSPAIRHFLHKTCTQIQNYVINIDPHMNN